MQSSPGNVNFFGAPAMDLQRFRSYRQDLILGASLTVTAPTGQYDSSRLVNLGTNRWSARPELGASKALGHLTLELLNTGPARLKLHRDMPVARANIWRMDGASCPPIPHGHYGRPEQLGSRYAAEFGVRLAAIDTRA